MLTIIAVAYLSLSALAAVEPTNFDYATHGDDWDGCPKNGNPPTYFSIQAIPYPPIRRAGSLKI